MQVSAALVLWTIPLFFMLSAVEWIDYRRDPDKPDNAFSLRDSAGNWVSYLLNASIKVIGHYVLPFSVIVVAGALAPLHLSARIGGCGWRVWW